MISGSAQTGRVTGFRVLEESASVAEGVVVPPESVVQDQAGELHDDCAQPSRVGRRVRVRLVNQSPSLGFEPAVRSQQHRDV
jgi:hypothetical protein